MKQATGPAPEVPLKHPRLTQISHILEAVAHSSTLWVGSSWAFLVALALTIAWMVTGPFFHYSDTWQLVMNTVSSIVTFLMVFLIQRSQNKDSLAMQLKLNELLAAVKGASNRLINVEDLSEEEVLELRDRYEKLRERARNGNIRGQLSIEEMVRGQASDGSRGQRKG
jgi:low affinity Fe/Cu permease